MVTLSPAGASIASSKRDSAAARSIPTVARPLPAPTMVAGSRFIFGEPMKPATNRLLGLA